MGGVWSLDDSEQVCVVGVSCFPGEEDESDGRSPILVSEARCLRMNVLGGTIHGYEACCDTGTLHYALRAQIDR